MLAAAAAVPSSPSKASLLPEEEEEEEEEGAEAEAEADAEAAAGAWATAPAPRAAGASPCHAAAQAPVPALAPAPPVRVELVADFGPKKGKVVSEVVEPTHEALLRLLQNKLQMKKKEALLVTLYCLDEDGPRPLPKADLSEFLANGAKVVACQGEPDPQCGQWLGCPKVRKALDQLCLVPAGKGCLSARGRPSLDTLAALQRGRGVTAIVTLLRHDEGAGAAESVGQACEKLGLRWCHAPLQGPKEMGMIGTRKPQVTKEDLASFRKAREVKEWLEAGEENVVVHCAAGLHRTGIYLFLLLRLLGEEPAEALEKIRQMRQATFDEFVKLQFQPKVESLVAYAAGAHGKLRQRRRAEAARPPGVPSDDDHPDPQSDRGQGAD